MNQYTTMRDLYCFICFLLHVQMDSGATFSHWPYAMNNNNRAPHASPLAPALAPVLAPAQQQQQQQHASSKCFEPLRITSDAGKATASAAATVAVDAAAPESLLGSQCEGPVTVLSLVAAAQPAAPSVTCSDITMNGMLGSPQQQQQQQGAMSMAADAAADSLLGEDMSSVPSLRQMLLTSQPSDAAEHAKAQLQARFARGAAFDADQLDGAATRNDADGGRDGGMEDVVSSVAAMLAADDVDIDVDDILAESKAEGAVRNTCQHQASAPAHASAAAFAAAFAAAAARRPVVGRCDVDASLESIHEALSRLTTTCDSEAFLTAGEEEDEQDADDGADAEADSDFEGSTSGARSPTSCPLPRASRAAAGSRSAAARPAAAAPPAQSQQQGQSAGSISLHHMRVLLSSMQASHEQSLAALQTQMAVSLNMLTQQHSAAMERMTKVRKRADVVDRYRNAGCNDTQYY